MRPYRDRARVFLAGRKGFARIAVRTGVPVVPLVTAGAQASFVVLTQGRALARALRLDRSLHWHSLPISLAIPWGVAIGPASFLPYFPAPVKVIVEVGEPIDPNDFEGDENDRVNAIYEATESQLQHRLTRLHNEGRVR
jgi:1-acyl-sn-glycerol-3-phosphate acyltransferase